MLPKLQSWNPTISSFYSAGASSPGLPLTISSVFRWGPPPQKNFFSIRLTYVEERGKIREFFLRLRIGLPNRVDQRGQGALFAPTQKKKIQMSVVKVEIARVQFFLHFLFYFFALIGMWCAFTYCTFPPFEVVRRRFFLGTPYRREQ